jgi:O-antigen ligase
LIILSAIITVISPVAGVILSLFIVLTMWSYVKPVYLFYIVFLMAPLQNLNLVYDSPLRIISERYPIIALPAIIALFVILLRKISIPQPAAPTRLLQPLFFVLLLIFAWTSISYLWTIDVYHGLNKIISLAIGIIFCLLTVSSINNKNEFERLFKILLPWGILLSLLLFISNRIEFENIKAEITQDIFLGINIITSDQRPGGFAPPQKAGNYLGFLFFIGIAIYPKVNKFAKFILFLIGLVFISSILSTGSKGAIGGFILAVLFFMFAYPQLRKRLIFTNSLFFSSVAAIFVINAIAFHLTRLTQSSKQATLSLSLRIEFWETGMEMLANRWIGAGVGGFAQLVDPWPGAHSFYFSILFDLGIIGIILFFIFIVMILYRLIKAMQNVADEDIRRYLYCIVSGLLLFLIHGIVDITFELPYFWIIISTALAIIKISEMEHRNKVPLDEKQLLYFHKLDTASR